MRLNVRRVAASSQKANRRGTVPVGQALAWIVACLWLGSHHSLHAQDATENAPSDVATFASAVDLLPAGTAGMVRFPSLPEFCEAGGQTNFGRLLDEPAVQDFRSAQRQLARKYLDSLDQKIGLDIQDVYEVASGEVVAAWLPYPQKKLRPYAVCVIADIRGRADKARAVLEQVDRDLKAQKATRVDKKHLDQTIRVYSPKKKVGELKIEQIAIWMDDQRIIASDRDSLVMQLIDAIEGESSEPTIGDAPLYRDIRQRTERTLLNDVKKLGGDQSEDGQLPIAVQWYAEPFAMGRIVKEALEIDRGNDVQILPLLENQGFDSIKALGGSVGIGIGDFDWLHRGVMIAPPEVEGDERYRLAARVLQFPNKPMGIAGGIPAWVPDGSASFVRMNWKIGPAFLALETLVDEVAGKDDFFQSLMRDYKNDDEGSGIDFLGKVVPNMGDQLLLVSDNVMPAKIDSERLLVAAEVTDPKVISQELRKVMMNEPGVELLDPIDGLPGIDIWKYTETDEDDSFEDELFPDFDDFEDDSGSGDEGEEERLLTSWTMTVATTAGGQSYLIFSSHLPLLETALKRMRIPPQAGFASQPKITQALQAMQSLGAEEVAVARLARLELTRRVKYSLLRSSQLKDSDSILAGLIRRALSEDDLSEPDPIQAGKLPPFEQIKKYFGTACNFVVTTEDGFSLNGFILK